MLTSSREDVAELARTTLGFDGAQQAAGHLLEVARRGEAAPQPAGMA